MSYFEILPSDCIEKLCCYLYNIFVYTNMNQKDLYLYLCIAIVAEFSTHKYGMICIMAMLSASVKYVLPSQMDWLSPKKQTNKHWRYCFVCVLFCFVFVVLLLFVSWSGSAWEEKLGAKWSTLMHSEVFHSRKKWQSLSKQTQITYQSLHFKSGADLESESKPLSLLVHCIKWTKDTTIGEWHMVAYDLWDKGIYHNML